MQLCLQEGFKEETAAWAKGDSLFSGLKMLKGLEDCQNLSSKHPLLFEAWKRYLQRAELASEHLWIHILVSADTCWQCSIVWCPEDAPGEIFLAGFSKNFQEYTARHRNDLAD